MNAAARRQRVAELTAARIHIDRQIRLLLGDVEAIPVELTPEQIRERAEIARLNAIHRYKDTPEQINHRRHEALTGVATWTDYKNRRTAA